MPQIQERMVSDVVTVEPSTRVVDAAKTMIEEEKGPLPGRRRRRPRRDGDGPRPHSASQPRA